MGGVDRLYLAAAEIVVAIHFLWIAFLVFGAWPGSRWRWVKWTHLTALTYSIFLQAFGWICPLTRIEWLLRAAGGGDAYTDTFIGQYLARVVYLPLDPNIVLSATVVIVAVSLWVYFGWHR